MARTSLITCTRHPRGAPLTGRLPDSLVRKIEIEMHPEIFISTLCESHLPFPGTTTATGRTRASRMLTLEDAHPGGVRKPPDEAMTILELLLLHLRACSGTIAANGGLR